MQEERFFEALLFAAAKGADQLELFRADLSKTGLRFKTEPKMATDIPATR